MRTAKTALPLALAAGLTLTASGAQAAQTILFNCFFPPRHYVCTDFLPELGTRIEAATEGRVRLRTPPKSLAAPPDQYDAVTSGVMDGAVQFNGFLAAQVPGVQFGMLPFVGRAGSESSSLALWRTYRAHFDPEEDYGEAVLLALFAFNGGDIYSVTDTPILSVEDLARRKIWSVPGVTAHLLADTGASVVSGPAVQMLEVVSKGVVDGHVGVPQSEVTQFQLTDYSPSATIFDNKVFQASFSFFVSRDAWEAIAEDDRAAIDAALGEDFVRWMGAFQDRVFDEAHATLEAAGTEFIPGDPGFLAELKRLGEEQVAGWLGEMEAAGVDGEAVLADYAAAHDAAEAEVAR